LLLAVLGVGSCVGLAFLGKSVGEKELLPPTDRDLERLSAGDYRGAYAQIHPDWRATATEEQYASIEASIHDQLGKNDREEERARERRR
jgi:hypothetical protein